MDWVKFAEVLNTVSSATLVVIVVLAFLWFRSIEKKKENGEADKKKDETKDTACQGVECPNQDAIEKQGAMIKEIHQVRLRDRTPFKAATDDAAADAAIHKGHAHSKITSRETKHTRKLQAETARAAGVSDERIKEIAAEIDNDKTGEFRAIDNGDPILEQDKS